MRRKQIRRRGAALLMAVLLLAGAAFPQPAQAAEFSSQEIETSYYEGANITIRIDGDEMRVTVPKTEDYSYIIVTFMDSLGNAPREARPVRVADGTAFYRIEEQRDGVYYVQLYRGKDAEGEFTDVIGGMESVAVLSESGEIRIIPSPVYDSSAAAFEAKAVSTDALFFYLQSSENVQSDAEQIRTLAEEITASAASTYDRLIAVHDWVASNIYYDFDAVRAQSGWPKDALGTLSSRRSVCEGYANLATALLRACGIPAKTIFGYALYGDDSSWTLSNMYGDRANHAWTEAFVDGRWVLMDTTWDSDNAYRNGEYKTGEAVHTYFDSTLEFFSYSHRQSREDEYDSSYIRTPFSDIEDHWAYESIRFAINQGLMDGVRESLFAPDESTTQAMFLAVLARMEGVTVKNSGKTAVDDGTGADEPESGDAAPWYRDAVLWAEENGILKGLASEFSPEDEIDREMMAVMLYNYILREEPELAEAAEGQTEPEAAAFTDAGAISGSAREAVRKTVSWGLLTGYEDGSFGPDRGMTRAEMATVIERIEYEKICIQSVDN